MGPAAAAWAASFLLLIEFLHYGGAILCYECNSATNYQCIEPLLPDSLRKNCSEHDKGDVKHTLCRKIVQHVEQPVNGRSVPARVIRACGWDDSKYKTSCYHRSGYGSRHEVCTCTSDLCNAAAALLPTLLLLAPALATVWNLR